MNIYEEFIAKFNNEKLIEVCHFLREEIMQHPHIKIQKKFNLPFFYGKTWVCYVNGIKKRKKITGIELCFVRGRELPSKELLDFKDRVMIGGLTFQKVADIDMGVLKLLLEEAMILDHEKPYTFVKRKKK